MASGNSWSWVGKSREEFSAEVKARDFARKLAPVKLPNPGGNRQDEKWRFRSLLPGQRKLTRRARPAEGV